MKRFLTALTSLLFLSATFAFAQAATSPTTTPATTATTASPTTGIIASTEATALSYQGSWSAATHITESFDLIDFGKTKTNHLYLIGHELMAPGPGVTSYLGGVRYAPDLSKLLAKTNVPVASFGAYFDGAIGNSMYSGKTGTNVTSMFGGGVQYKLTSALSWSSLHIAWLRVGGQNAVEMSTGLQYVFTH